jgi:SAM-dependent methyltransferase
MSEIYDRIGSGYSAHRLPDPRIARRIRQCIGDATSVVNVGAGAGSYEPEDLPTVAVEPSRTMIAQRRNTRRLVQARAESLPFRDETFDVAMAVLTVHHWQDPNGGFAECARTARQRIVVMTWDPESAGFWLVRDYLPEILEHDRRVFPKLSTFAAAWGRVAVLPVPVPVDCRDGFLGAFWRRPDAYLDPAVRAGMSSMTKVPDIDARMDDLRRDLESGAWERRNRDLLSRDEVDLGYRLVVADIG